MCVLSWRTVSVLTGGLFWWLFPSLLRNSGNKHQNNPLVSTETVRHSSTCIILYVPIAVDFCKMLFIITTSMKLRLFPWLIVYFQVYQLLDMLKYANMHLYFTFLIYIDMVYWVEMHCICHNNLLMSLHRTFFRITDPLGGIPTKWQAFTDLGVFCFMLHKSLSKLSNDRWFDTPWCSCDITVNVYCSWGGLHRRRYSAFYRVGLVSTQRPFY